MNREVDFTGSYIIGMDIGGTNLRLAALDLDGNIIKKHLESSGIIPGTANPADKLGEMISEFAAEIPLGLKGICIGFPGTVSKDKSMVHSCPNLPDFTDIQISGPLGERLGVPVYAEHDITMLMAYDLGDMPLEDISCVIGIYLGTGVGNAIWANGDFIYGADGAAGELGHVPVLGREDECPCGNRGCIELYTGGRHFKDMTDVLFPGVPTREVFTRHGDDGRLAEYLDRVGTVIAIEVNILNPDCVILGGGVIHMPDFPTERLKRAVLRHVRKPLPHDSLKFALASADKFAGAIGAARHMKKCLGL